jgi:PKD repeat protein
MAGNIFINTSLFEIRDYKIPTYSNIHDKVNYSNISLNGSYLHFNISLSNATNETFSIVEFTIHPNLNKNISSKIYVSNFTLYANKTPVMLPTKSLTVKIVERGNNTPPMGKITLSIRNNRVVDFYAISYDPDDEELKYYWDFGDGTNSTQQNPTHNYKNYSDYVVKLTIKDSLNASFSTRCVIPIKKYEPLNYTFSRKNFTESEKNKTTYLNLSIKNPLIWRVNAYVDFNDYSDLNLTKTQYYFELNPNETKALVIPINIEKTSTIKWSLALYPEIKDKYNKDPQLSYYSWDYSEKIEIMPPSIVKVNEITKYINLNTTDVVLKINKNNIIKEKYEINKTVELNLIEKEDVTYYCLITLVGFITGLILIRLIK